MHSNNVVLYKTTDLYQILLTSNKW